MSGNAPPSRLPPTNLLGELERDALGELANIGVSRAAGHLRKLVGQQVILSVPGAEVVRQETAIAAIGEREGDDLIAVAQDYSGPFSGRALLIFPHSNSLELVRLVVADSTATDLHAEALTEVGNIVINGCLASIANVLKVTLGLSLPAVIRGRGAHIFASWDASGDGLVLFIHVNFSVRDSEIRGYIALLMDLPEIENLKVALGEFIDEALQENSP
jgi:chemotaxis protein CheC